jgi:hypothetical protein
MGERQVAFTMLDEAVLHLEQHSAPWNVQLELGARDRLDPDRIRESAARACADHAMLWARREPFRVHEQRYRWALPDEPSRLPIEETEVSDREELAAFRSRFYSPTIDLDESPPWRAAIVHRADGNDLLALAVSHVAADGVGTVRFARSLAAAGAGLARRLPPAVPPCRTGHAAQDSRFYPHSVHSDTVRWMRLVWRQ